MDIRTCYAVDIKRQLDAVPDKETKGLLVYGSHRVDDRLMKATADLCQEALSFCVSVFLEEWDLLGSLPGVARKRAADRMLHSTRDNTADYPEFDLRFAGMPAYTRRTVIAKALGVVSSYRSNLANWQALPPAQRGKEPTLGLSGRYELTFYDQERKLSCLDKGQIGLKLYNGHSWEWYYFQIAGSDASYLSGLCRTRKMLSPVVEKVRGRYRIRFCFEEETGLVQGENRLAYRVLAVDLGINAAASWCVMTADGTVHAKGVIRLSCEEDRLRRMVNRKRKYQKAGKKSRSIYRWIRGSNRRLSIETTRALMKVAVLYSVDCIVFEHLDRKGKISGKKFRERIHLWRKNDVQKRVELQAHRHGMRISRVCAWGTSKLAYDGSGHVDRHSVFRYRHGEQVYNYSLCTFPGGKVYNCDLSAAQNIGARFFLREYQKNGAEGLPPTPQRTLCTLRMFVDNGLPGAPAA